MSKYSGPVLRPLMVDFRPPGKVVKKYSKSTPPVHFGGAREARPPKMHRQTTFRVLFHYFSGGPKIHRRRPEYLAGVLFHYLCTCFWPLLGTLGLWSTALHKVGCVLGACSIGALLEVTREVWGGVRLTLKAFSDNSGLLFVTKRL